MKLSTALSALLFSALAPWASGAAISTCALQRNCITFETSVVSSEAACSGLSSDCVVEVCLHLNTGKNAGETNSCVKGSGNGVSHICDGGDSNGCQRGAPASIEMDGGTDESCRQVNDGARVMSDHKCEEASDVRMCQVGNPGEQITFVIKDGQDTTTETASYGSGTCANPTITCQNAGTLNCGGGTNQALYERAWVYTIPSDFCNSCPAPTPPATESAPITTTAPNIPPTTNPPTPAPTPACVEANCIAAGNPNYFHTGECGRHFCDTNTDSCAQSVSAGADCTLSHGQHTQSDGCYIGTKCSSDGSDCEHVFHSPGTACTVPGEDSTSFDSVCVDPPTCVSSASGPTGATHCERNIKEDDPCIIPGETEPDSVEFGKGPCHAGDYCTAAGKCESEVHGSSVECRAAADCCDAAEYCTDNGFTCPDDVYEPEDTVCRAPCAGCVGDDEEVCSGDSIYCPKDVVFDDDLCIYAGQTSLIGMLDVSIVEEVNGDYTIHMNANITTSLQDVAENVKIWIGTTQPPSNWGNFNIKAEYLYSVSRSLSALDYDVCADPAPGPLYFAVHFDAVDTDDSAETAWALPCGQTEHLDAKCWETGGANNPRCQGWARYFELTPCCAESNGCDDSCVAEATEVSRRARRNARPIFG